MFDGSFLSLILTCSTLASTFTTSFVFFFSSSFIVFSSFGRPWGAPEGPWFNPRLLRSLTSAGNTIIEKIPQQRSYSAKVTFLWIPWHLEATAIRGVISWLWEKLYLCDSSDSSCSCYSNCPTYLLVVIIESEHIQFTQQERAFICLDQSPDWCNEYMPLGNSLFLQPFLNS